MSLKYSYQRALAVLFMTGFADGAKRCWTTIAGCPGWLKLLISIVILSLFAADMAPPALRWPIRFLVPPFAIWGFLETFFVLRGRSVRQVTLEFVRHPFVWMLGLVGISSMIKENYPFSHYPMYSKPGPVKEYYYLGKVGEAGETVPVPMGHVTTQTSAKTGRIYRGRRNAYLEENQMHREDLTQTDRERIGAEVLDLLHTLSEKRHGKGSAREVWRLVKVVLEVGPDGLKETPTIIAERDFTK